MHVPATLVIPCSPHVRSLCPCPQFNAIMCVLLRSRNKLVLDQGPMDLGLSNVTGGGFGRIWTLLSIKWIGLG
jgi:hypothetical protein